MARILMITKHKKVIYEDMLTPEEAVRIAKRYNALPDYKGVGISFEADLSEPPIVCNLPVTTSSANLDSNWLKVKLGDKVIGKLTFQEPVLPGSEPRWWLVLDSGKWEVAGLTREDAVEFALKYYGYKSDQERQA